MKTLKPRLKSLLFASMFGPALVHSAPLLTLSPPSGVVRGAPGATVGWGFTISNPDSNFLVVTSANFCNIEVVGGITLCDQFASPTLGVFTDYMAQFNFIVAGPAPESPSVSQTFNQNLHTGIGGFAISPGAVVRTNFTGDILLTYDLYSRSPNDPLFDSGADFISGGNTLMAPASVTATPEPPAFLMLATGLVGLPWGIRRSCIKIHTEDRQRNLIFDP